MSEILDRETSDDAAFHLAAAMRGRVEVNVLLLRALRSGFNP
ncbi:MAG TPA: hypothetical protein VNI54_11110 [Thermoanaerobaculia bacterium]|nr:hypothetical protein [Thermoanaerobaculia bacterium]